MLGKQTGALCCAGRDMYRFLKPMGGCMGKDAHTHAKIFLKQNGEEMSKL